MRTLINIAQLVGLWLLIALLLAPIGVFIAKFAPPDAVHVRAERPA